MNQLARRAEAAAKAAMDSIAVTMSYELARFGVDLEMEPVCL